MASFRARSKGYGSTLTLDEFPGIKRNAGRKIAASPLNRPIH
jgi:hypothetical protein